MSSLCPRHPWLLADGRLVTAHLQGFVSKDSRRTHVWCFAVGENLALKRAVMKARREIDEPVPWHRVVCFLSETNFWPASVNVVRLLKGRAETEAVSTVCRLCQHHDGCVQARARALKEENSAAAEASCFSLVGYIARCVTCLSYHDGLLHLVPCKRDPPNATYHALEPSQEAHDIVSALNQRGLGRACW